MTALAPSLRADNTPRTILSMLAQRIGPQRFNAWFRHGTQLDVEENHVRVSVPNPFVANWMETHFQAEIAAVVAEHTGRTLPVIVTVDAALTGECRKNDLDTQADLVAKAQEGRLRPRRAAAPVALRGELDDFVVGPSNRMAYSAALAITEAPVPPFNPLFIHGPCGVGKTHLLQGICNAVSRRRRDGRPCTWRYVTGEQFTNEFISALRAKRVDEFRGRYRNLDMLAIDDVHFLAAKKATQDEFLHTYNTIESGGRQVVMASDAHPRLVGEFNPQLVSRFVAGMVVKVDAPDKDTRLAILARRSRMMKLRVSADVLDYVAVHIRGSVRELEGTLIKLAALAELGGKTIDLPLAVSALSDHLARTDSALTLGDIESAVGAYFAITPADIHSSRRTRPVSAARMIAMFLARRHTTMSFPEIGRAMGKHHSSVIQAVQRVAEMIAADEPLSWTGPAGPKSVPAGELIETLSAQLK
ncbi:MAG: chromosomal replication initiator protein DnaA [Planctomycetaceae bacterium]|nr:chromosomal replication initiator protein DnaA [Planctomycetaceae bacterium]